MFNKFVKCYLMFYNRDLNKFSQTIFNRCVKNTLYFIIIFFENDEHLTNIIKNNIKLIHDFLDAVI